MSTPTTSTSAAGLAARNRERIERARQHLARIERADAAGGKAVVLGALNDLSLELANAGAKCGLLGRPFSFDAFGEWLAPEPGE